MSNMACGPVAWTDGMLIEVQHFQQLERHLGHYFDARHALSSNHAWGFVELDLDTDRLNLGSLSLRRARGLFPDGTPFSLPTHEPLPPALDTHHASPGDIACLAVQMPRSGGAEMAFSDAGATARYRATEAEVSDHSIGLEGSGAPRRLAMQLGSLQARLCWRSQLRSDETCLPLARVAGRSPTGAVTLDPRFIPPLLDARAHITLRTLTEELESVLRMRLAGSASLRVLSSGGGIADLVEMLLRQALAEYRMRLSHLDAFDPLPPSLLYQELVGLLGRLSVLPGIEDELLDLRLAYRHDELQASFEPLAQMLRRALARVIETPVVPLRFEDRGDGVHLCLTDPQWRLQKLVFAFTAAMPAEPLRKLLPQQAKFGPVEQIQKLVDLQLPGARLTALAHPPRQLPYYAQSVYFEVESGDPFWAQTLAGSAMALRIVGDFPELRFEAWGLREAKVG